MAKYLDRCLAIRTKCNKVRIFSAGNEQLVNKSSMNGHHEAVGKYLEKCRKIFRTLMKSHSRPNFVTIKQKTLRLETWKIFGKFSVTSW